MSYNCEISFKKCEAKDIIPFFKNMKKVSLNRLKEIAKSNCSYCPIVRDKVLYPKNFSDVPREDIKKSENWALNSVFKYRYFYDEDKGLLGVYGVPDAIKDLFDGCVYFQNSCDQNYKLSDWGNIQTFIDIYNKWQSYSDEKIMGVYKEKYKSDFNEDYPKEDYDQSEEIDYYKKTFCYEEIWGLYENTLFNEEETIYISMFGQYDILEMNKFSKYCFDYEKEQVEEFMEKYEEKEKIEKHNEKNENNER